ncbi:MAG TPA: hypothetical protein ENK57_12125 [Polyangiaceae bacterium]|nr:hypothetical protein [Polyangiaceae bacterium]
MSDTKPNGDGVGPALEHDPALEMRIRVANKVEAVLREEAEHADMTITEAMHILGMVLGIGMAGAPSVASQQLAAKAHQLGVLEGMKIRRAVAKVAEEVEA